MIITNVDFNKVRYILHIISSSKARDYDDVCRLDAGETIQRVEPGNGVLYSLHEAI